MARGAQRTAPPDPDEFAAQLLGVELDDQPPQTQSLLQYIWARMAIDDGILTLVGEDHTNGAHALICARPEDGLLYAVERPPGWSREDETRVLAQLKAILEGKPSDAVFAGHNRLPPQRP